MVSVKKRFLGFLTATFVASICSSQAAFAEDDNTLFKYLADFGYGIYLLESGFSDQADRKMTLLLSLPEFTKQAAPAFPKQTAANAKNGPIPLLRADIKCGASLIQLQSEALELRALAVYDRKKERARAEADLQHAIKLCPDHPYLHLSLAKLYRKSRNPKKAFPELQKAELLSKDIPEIYLERAALHQQMGASTAAGVDIAIGKKLTLKKQKQLDSLNDAIKNLDDKNKSTEALATAEKLVRIFPRDVYALAEYADRLASTGKFNAAMRYADLATKLDPTFARGYRVRARCHAFFDHPELELGDATWAFLLEPRSPNNLYMRAVANLDNDKPAQAVRDFTLLTKTNPEFADSYINRSAANLRLNNADDAVRDARKGLALAPRSPEAYAQLAASLRRARVFDLAQKAVEQVFQYSKSASSDTLALAHFTRAAVLHEQQQYRADVNEELDEAIKLAPQLAGVLLRRGTYDAGKGATDRGLQILLNHNGQSNTPKVSKLTNLKTIRTTKDKSVLRHEAAFQISKNDLLDCIFVVNRMIESTPERANNYLIRGTARYGLGLYAEAAADFEKFVELSDKKSAPGRRAAALEASCRQKTNNVPPPPIKLRNTIFETFKNQQYQ